MQFDKCELRSSVDRDEHVEFVLLCADLCKVDMEVSNGVGTELAALWLVTFHLGQPADVVALQAAMQRRSGQVRNSGLQGVETVIQRQQRVLAEGNDNRFFLDGEHRGMSILRAGSHIGSVTPAPPLGDRLRVDPVALGQDPQALLTILYCSTDCRCRAGASVKNLSHSASFILAWIMHHQTPGPNIKICHL